MLTKPSTLMTSRLSSKKGELRRPEDLGCFLVRGPWRWGAAKRPLRSRGCQLWSGLLVIYSVWRFENLLLRKNGSWASFECVIIGIWMSKLWHVMTSLKRLLKQPTTCVCLTLSQDDISISATRCAWSRVEKCIHVSFKWSPATTSKWQAVSTCT